MARKRFDGKPDSPKTELVKAYRVARNSCIHAGIEYKVGDRLPEMPVAQLNVHLPNLELVEVEEVLGEETVTEPEPNEAVAIITQVEADGGADYAV